MLSFGPTHAHAQPGLTPHGPILIQPTFSGENFTALSGVTGTGAPTDPFIISNLEIATNSSYGIHIHNTRSFFIIRNTLIQGTRPPGLSQGVFLDSVQNGIIDSLNITGFYYGVQISAGYGNIVQNSRIWNNTDGVFVQSSNQQVRNNRLYNNTEYGASVQGSSFNTFRDNNSSYNGNVANGAGFFIQGSNNIFDHNIVFGNTWFGIKMVGSPLQASSNNVFSNNTISTNGGTPDGGGICRCDGGGLVFANNDTFNLIIRNTVSDQDNGIGLETDAVGDYNNNLTLNRVIHDRFGLYIVEGSKNLVYDNLFNSTTNVLDTNVQNAWNITKTLKTNILGGPFTGGNFFSDYSGTDADGDGFGDTPYTTSDSHRLDFLPLMLNQPTAVHDIVALSTSAPTSVRVGTNVAISSKLFNGGTVPESFNVIVTETVCHPTCQQTTIATMPINIPAYTVTTITTPWDTTGLLPGAYSLSTKAETIPGETNTTNNQSPATTINLTINTPPIANFTITSTTPAAGDTVTLNAAASYDPDGTITQYHWNFGDTTAATGQQVSHSWTLAQIITVTLTVIDNEGATSIHSLTVNVTSTQPTIPQNFALSAISGRSVLTWNPPSSFGGSAISGYLIFRASSPSGPWTNIANTTATSYVDSNVTEAQTYYYQVSAINQAELTSRPTNSLNVLIPTSPAKPQDYTIISAIIAAIAVAAASILVLRKSRRKLS